MPRKYNLAVFIGRFQPFHNGHIKNIEKGLEVADNVLVLLGSANQPRTIKNPFTTEERELMLCSCFPEEVLHRIFIQPVRDYLYQDNAWIKEVQDRVEFMQGQVAKSDNYNIAILGYEKDESSYYLRAFPTWDFVDTGTYAEVAGQVIDATKIRQLLFEDQHSYIKGVVHPNVFGFLTEKFTKTDDYRHLKGEYDFIKEYKKQWEASPYPPIFFTLDAVVVQGGHILLIKRKASPGKGLWALPGGFIQPNETALDGMIRELREETRLKVPTPVLKGSIKKEMVFDAPGRSLRGRTITYAFYMQLDNATKLPAVRGSDDAAEARWFKISEVLEASDTLYEDHHSIISMMTGLQ